MTNPLYRNLFWLVSTVIAIAGLLSAESLFSLNTVLGFAIGVAALLPSYLWVHGFAHGVPILPIMSLFYLNTFALPLVVNHPAVQKYTDMNRLLASVTIIGYLLLSTMVWRAFAQVRTVSPSHFVGFHENRSGGIFIVFLAIGCFFVSPLFWEVFPTMPSEFHKTIKMGVLGLAILSTAVLGYQWGNEKLSIAGKLRFFILIALYLMFETAGLMIHGAYSIILTIAATYTLARGKLPTILLLVTLPLLALLHLGKWQMRDYYWGERPKTFPGYVVYYSDWFSYGLSELNINREETNSRKSQKSSAAERASVIQMLMLVQTKSPDQVPFMDGYTYSMIPELLVPRFITPDKPWSHEGTYRLCIHYGLQTRAQTRKTTIGFGPLAESYANFGFPGVVALSILTGCVCGFVARWGIGLPITSFQGLFGLLVLSALLQTESTLGVIVASLFQGSMALIAVRIVLMRKITNPTLEIQPLPFAAKAHSTTRSHLVAGPAT